MAFITSLGLADRTAASHNDQRVDAESVAAPGSREHNNLGATLETSEHRYCSGASTLYGEWGATVWYRFTAPANGTATFRAVDQGEELLDTLNGDQIGNEDGFFDTVIAAHLQGSDPWIDCNDDDPGGNDLSSRLDLPVSAGATYELNVGGLWPFYYQTPGVCDDQFLGEPDFCHHEQGYFKYSVEFTATPAPPATTAAKKKKKCKRKQGKSASAAKKKRCKKKRKK